MSTRLITLALLIAAFLGHPAQASPGSMEDSLLASIATMPSPIQQVDSLNEWAWNLYKSYPEVALALAAKSVQISQGNHYDAGESDAYKRIGTIQRFLGNEELSLQAYQAALTLKQKQGDKEAEASILGNIGNVYLDQESYELAIDYFQQALEINLHADDQTMIIQQYHGIGSAYQGLVAPDSATHYFRLAVMVANNIPDSDKKLLWLARSWLNLGGPLADKGLRDSAAFYWKLSAVAFDTLGLSFEFADALNNIGYLYLETDPKLALDSFFRPALAISITSRNAHQRQAFLDNVALAHEKAHNLDSALYYFKAYQALHDTLFNQEKSEDIALLETRYRVKEKDAANQLLQSEGQRKTIIILAVAIIAALIAAIATYMIHAQRRRLKIQRELALHQQKQDAQRILELVQNQELRALESLIEGQEQERSRLATEIHDGLGSLLATIKLYFNQLNASDQTQQTALQKADHILDEACKEVRRYSHGLAGLPVVQFGLVNAVHDLAKSISDAGKLKIQVYTHQMENRLPLPLERSIYKVIQELLTNVIKHAHATAVTIQFSRHEEHLNIILEDNGKGMDTSLQPHQAGLGLRSVRARLDAMGAEWALDSKPGYGTTALIDIPLKEGSHD